jgi:hypothetical protein
MATGMSISTLCSTIFLRTGDPGRRALGRARRRLHPVDDELGVQVGVIAVRRVAVDRAGTELLPEPSL